MRALVVTALTLLIAAVAAQVYPSDVPQPPTPSYASGSGSGSYASGSGSYASGSGSYASGSGSYASGSGSNEYYEVKERYYRQLYHAEVNVSQDGWIHYCPEYHDWSSTAPYEATCNSFRPWNYREIDQGDKVTEVQYEPGHKRQAVSLANWTYIGSSRNSSLPACYSNGTAGPDPCGQTDAGEPLWYATLPVTVELYAVAEGHVQIDARTYLHRGWYYAGGKNYSVWPGTATYDVSIHGYKFAERGWAVHFDIQSRWPQGTTTVGNLTAKDSDALETPNSRIVCAPKYRASNGSLALSGEYMDAWVRLNAPGNASQPDLIAKYRFAGPFLNVVY